MGERAVRVRAALVVVGVLAIAGVFALCPREVSAVAAPPDASAGDLAGARALSKVFQSVARKLEPAVVHITQLNRVRDVRRDIFGFPTGYGETRLQQTGLGSGVIVSSDGYVLTNNHVVQNADTLLVRLNDRRELEGKVLGRDPATDLAVLKIDAAGLAYAEFADSDQLEVGEWVVAIGSPFGFSNTVTSGIVSAKGRSGIIGLQDYQDFIQTDAAINPGNSGGPLLNLEGKIVGINSAIASRTGGYEGLGFAIPSNVAHSTMESIVKTGHVARGWLGVSFEDEPARRGAATAPGRVRVDRVLDDSPASRAGLRAGDVVLSYRGRPIDDVAQLRTAIALTVPNTVVPIEVERGGSRVKVDAKVGDQTVDLAASQGGLVVADAGLSVRTLDPEDAMQLGYRNVRGVIVLAVSPGGRAEAAEIKPGDIVVAVDDTRTPTAESLTKALRSVNYSDGVRLNIIRGNMRGSITLQD